MIPKNRGENFSSGFLHSEFFGGGVSLYTSTLLIVALSLGRSDITSFRPWSPVVTVNYLDCTKKIPYFAQMTGTVDVFDPCSGISGPTLWRASTCPNLYE